MFFLHYNRLSSSAYYDTITTRRRKPEVFYTWQEIIMRNKINKENKLYWRKLDNSAKIFPISNGKKYSTVFRLSVVLNQKSYKKH